MRCLTYEMEEFVWEARRVDDLDNGGGNPIIAFLGSLCLFQHASVVYDMLTRGGILIAKRGKNITR